MRINFVAIMIFERKVRVLVTLRTRFCGPSRGCDIKNIHEKERIFFSFLSTIYTQMRRRSDNWVKESREKLCDRVEYLLIQCVFAYMVIII